MAKAGNSLSPETFAQSCVHAGWVEAGGEGGVVASNEGVPGVTIVQEMPQVLR